MLSCVSVPRQEAGHSGRALRSGAATRGALRQDCGVPARADAPEAEQEDISHQLPVGKWVCKARPPGETAPRAQAAFLPAGNIRESELSRDAGPGQPTDPSSRSGR